mmetsp:Transcript_417/g.1038  ORF Transcript_417/g.1038 Transcript_417/m.1038 type:complete len:265 (+) Transcript_417:1194-1988(+)
MKCQAILIILFSIGIYRHGADILPKIWNIVILEKISQRCKCIHDSSRPANQNVAFGSELLLFGQIKAVGNGFRKRLHLSIHHSPNLIHHPIERDFGRRPSLLQSQPEQLHHLLNLQWHPLQEVSVKFPIGTRFGEKASGIERQIRLRPFHPIDATQKSFVPFGIPDVILQLSHIQLVTQTFFLRENLVKCRIRFHKGLHLAPNPLIALDQLPVCGPSLSLIFHRDDVADSSFVQGDSSSQTEMNRSAPPVKMSCLQSDLTVDSE